MRSMKIVIALIVSFFVLNVGASPADRRERRQERRENRQENRQDRREDRRDNRQDRREDRRENRQERRHDRRDNIKDAVGAPPPAASPEPAAPAQ